MRLIRVVNRSRGIYLAERAELSCSFLERGRGLLGRSELASGEGMVLLPCKWVHSFFMRFTCSLVYVDGRGLVLKVVDRFPPNRIGPLVLRSRYVVELPAGIPSLTSTVPGDLIELEPLNL